MKEADQRQVWSKRLEEQKTSGKTIAAWCQEQSLSESKFYYWRKKLYAEELQNNKTIKWLSLNSNIDTPTQIAYENPGNTLSVHIGQATIEIKRGFDPELLAQVLKVLKTIC